jgi:hypothetical protein
MINHFVIMSCILSIDYKWLSLQGVFVSSLYSLSSFLSEFVRFKCLLMEQGEILSESQSAFAQFANNSKRIFNSFEIFHEKLIFSVLFPIFIMVMMMILFCLTNCKLKMIPRTKIVCMSVITFWFLQPDVCKVLFASLSCMQIADEQRLMLDLEVVCWVGNHHFLVRHVTLPAIAVYVVLIPCFISY